MTTTTHSRPLLARALRSAAALIVVAGLGAASTASAASMCKVSRAKVVSKKSMPATQSPSQSARGSCRAVARRYVVTNKETGHQTEVLSEQLRCGKLRLGSHADMRSEAIESCEVGSEFAGMVDFEIDTSFEVIAAEGRYVSVDTFDGGYTGGAHPYASITRRTYDTRRGKAVSLARVIGRQKATEVIARAKAVFDSDEETTEGYEFDEDAFAWDGKTISFAMPHAYEVVRGTTYDIEINLADVVTIIAQGGERTHE